MEKKVEICKKCGNHVVGTPHYDTSRQMTREAAKSAANWGLKLGIIGFCSIAGLVFGFGVGALPGFIIGIIISCFFGNSRDEVVDAVYENVYDSTTFTFDCPKCGYEWSHVLGHREDTTTDAYLDQRKRKMIEKYDSDAGGSIWGAIALLILGLLSLWYWNTHTMQDSFWVACFLLFCGVFIIVCAIGFLSQLSSYFKAKEKADKLRKMSLNEYRFSEERYEKL